jgi:hypothetical protein
VSEPYVRLVDQNESLEIHIPQCDALTLVDKMRAALKEHREAYPNWTRAGLLWQVTRRARHDIDVELMCRREAQLVMHDGDTVRDLFDMVPMEVFDWRNYEEAK